MKKIYFEFEVLPGDHWHIKSQQRDPQHILPAEFTCGRPNVQEVSCEVTLLSLQEFHSEDKIDLAGNLEISVSV